MLLSSSSGPLAAEANAEAGNRADGQRASLLPHTVRAAEQWWRPGRDRHGGGQRGRQQAQLVVRPLRRPVRGPPDGAAHGQATDTAGGRQGRHADVRAQPGGDGADAEARGRNPGARV